MDELRYTYKKTGRLDHAYLLTGNVNGLRNDVYNFLSKDVGVIVENNTDCVFEEYDSFGIGESRNLKEMQSFKGFGGANRYFVISTSFFTFQAQNALLKIFEEPCDGVFIFLIVPTSDIIIATLQSRLQILNSPVIIDDNNGLFANFVSSDIQNRLKEVKKIIADKDKRNAKKTALKLLDSIEESLSKNEEDKLRNKDVVYALNEVIFARKYIFGSSPSLKMILEHLALITPLVGGAD